MSDTEEGKSHITHFEKIIGFKNISWNLQFISDSCWRQTYFFNSTNLLWIVSNKTYEEKCKTVCSSIHQVVKCFRRLALAKTEQNRIQYCSLHVFYRRQKKIIQQEKTSLFFFSLIEINLDLSSQTPFKFSL